MLLTLPAPAKLNLILRVLGRRPDGYHELQTLFQLLNYGDSLEFSENSAGTITVDAGSLEVAEEDNLVFRAAQLLRQHVKPQLKRVPGAHIRLIKNLPHGGGIGGGSSDAATTLLGLNQLWRCHLSIDQLAEIGQQLGADIPVFVRGRTAWAEGIGEKLTPITTDERHYLVISTGCEVSTAKIFRDSRLTRDSVAITLAALREGQLNEMSLSSAKLEALSGNDCQKLVEKLYPEIRDAREWLEQFAPAQLTGSGGCIFAAFPSAQAALKVFAKLPKGWKGFTAAGVLVSPTHRALSKISSSGRGNTSGA
ncbi:4-(cytidine 5'-diphospho)-2-C-methyl-D-erythritol kinase [Microbulbifer sp. OS29]|uniref:4-diphosphocytidyl-2-C-methyl-D-erythritol kinase n=1 Tax=Microbulbifer okhotskensis TaxID=2926617 RepID=A0A9X2J3Q4_9GAMM|nr:4-(cytidine 5'-diphospho)-2-C-methyl-D-erythritol kinase [Microbulbifer okhotskensis]MCO1333762.1 4-(cytidine 5'-diphospho)-2-C-methyl-D-erythritol kinase [Microbulbifer okhotskensis]